jgi:hypothetical protein
MKIPKQLNISGYNYDIIMVNNRTKGDGNDAPASCSSKYQKIWVDKEQHQDQQESGLIHEIIEAIDYHYALHLEHDKIMTLEAALYQALKDNKLLK